MESDRPQKCEVVAKFSVSAFPFRVSRISGHEGALTGRGLGVRGCGPSTDLSPLTRFAAQIDLSLSGRGEREPAVPMRVQSSLANSRIGDGTRLC